MGIYFLVNLININKVKMDFLNHFKIENSEDGKMSLVITIDTSNDITPPRRDSNASVSTVSSVKIFLEDELCTSQADPEGSRVHTSPVRRSSVQSNTSSNTSPKTSDQIQVKPDDIGPASARRSIFHDSIGEGLKKREQERQKKKARDERNRKIFLETQRKEAEKEAVKNKSFKYQENESFKFNLAEFIKKNKIFLFIVFLFLLVAVGVVTYWGKALGFGFN